MRIRTFASLIGAALLAAACDSSTGPTTSVTELPGLEQQESKWQSRGLHDYHFDYHYQFAGVKQAARIYITSDAVAAVMDLATDSALSLDASAPWPTVDSLFTRARVALASEDVDVKITCDAMLGYPTRIDVSPKVATPAGGSSTRAEGLKPMVVLSPQ
ncbi:MAG TPA: DUF6174 domain-containing protein [Gemmatimonadaceae bacterium]|jgi:hypothetical protein|nr:DUF6174 domain-containing protein [Gemmatimonadaceae bacterium]